MNRESTSTLALLATRGYQCLHAFAEKAPGAPLYARLHKVFGSRESSLTDSLIADMARALSVDASLIRSAAIADGIEIGEGRSNRRVDELPKPGRRYVIRTTEPVTIGDEITIDYRGKSLRYRVVHVVTDCDGSTIARFKRVDDV